MAAADAWFKWFDDISEHITMPGSPVSNARQLGNVEGGEKRQRLHGDQRPGHGSRGEIAKGCPALVTGPRARGRRAARSSGGSVVTGRVMTRAAIAALVGGRDQRLVHDQHVALGPHGRPKSDTLCPNSRGQCRQVAGADHDQIGAAVARHGEHRIGLVADRLDVLAATPLRSR